MQMQLSHLLVRMTSFIYLSQAVDLSSGTAVYYLSPLFFTPPVNVNISIDSGVSDSVNLNEPSTVSAGDAQTVWAATDLSPTESHIVVISNSNGSEIVVDSFM